MDKKQTPVDILNEIEKAAPPFQPAHALEALQNTDIYTFRYFPKLHMIVLTERLCEDFRIPPVYHDMPDSFANDFVAAEDRDIFKKMYLDIDDGIPSSTGNFRGINKVTWYRVTLTTVEWDSENKPELCTGIVENRTEEALVREELNTILSSISCGVLQYRQSDNKLLRANQAALDILGYDSVESLEVDREHGVVQTVLPEDRLYIKNLVDSLTQPGEVKACEYRVRHKNSNQIRYCYGTVQVYDDVHGERIVQRSVMDITDRKLREDMQQTNSELMIRLDTVMSGILGGFEITLDDPSFTYVFLSKGVAALQGYTVSELLEKYHGNVLENIYPDDRAAIVEKMKDLTYESGTYTIKYRLRHKDGHLIWVSETGKKVRDKDGTSLFYCLVQDISESQKRAEELNHLLTKQNQMITDIRRERRQYRTALVSDSVYSYRFDVTEGMVLQDFEYSTIGSLKHNLGVTTPIAFDELIQRWSDVMKPEFLTPDEQNPMTTEEVKACYNRGLKHIVTEYYNRQTKTYYRRLFLLSEDDETGHIWAIAIVNNITNSVREETRKRNELAMINHDLQNQINISRAFSSIYYATWDVDLQTGRLEEISVPKWIANIQMEADDNFKQMIDTVISSHVKEESAGPLHEFLRLDNMAERLRLEMILNFDFQGNHYGWSTISLIPYLRDEDGNVLRVIFAVREINKEKRMELEAKQALEQAYEAANRANAAKTQFLSSVSHDIRTPMNGIIGMTAIAGTHLDDKERVADCLSKISVASKHLLGLINEVLDMNKIESGKLDLNVEKFSLSELIDTILIVSKSQVEAKNHRLVVNIQNVKHEFVVGDSLRLQQVFVNLLSNAIKYTPEGGTIKLALTEKVTNNPKIGCFEFIVEDNGIGMSKEFQEELFEPFTRAKDTRVDKIQGTGLGMPIARNIVRMMNGDILVESELSKGTKFTVTIFLELQDDDEAFSYEDFIDLPVLVVDDNAVACESTCVLLKELGMHSEWVVTGEDAIHKTLEHHAADNDYFAIIMDWKMPEKDGVSTTREIREKIGDKVPIIIISAYDWSDIEQEARAAGVNAFISKPLFKSRLSYTFKNLLHPETEPSTQSVMKELEQQDFSGKRALLAEDNELNAEIAGDLLGMTGIEIEYAINGKEAVELVTNNPEGYFDIIFMDIQMPVMNGYEATKTIRALPGDYEKNIPIIAMTANAFAEDVQAAKNAGMNEHIAKPLSIELLTKALKRWLK